METLRAIREFDWQTAWTATKNLCAIVGCIAMFSYFAGVRLWIQILSALVLACMWALIFKLLRGMNARPRGSEIPKPRRSPQGRITPSVSQRLHSAEAKGVSEEKKAEPKMVSRFVYFDAETGEDVYKLEPAA